VRATVRTSDIDACGLTFSELQELWLGPCNGGSVFDTPEQLRDAWDRGREVVMRLWARGGKRPLAWWCYEAPALGLEWPGYDRQQSTLWRTPGVLSAEERSELEVTWREAFDQARGKSARERREHLAHCDVPDELIREWAPARRRRTRAIRSEDDAVRISQPGSG
jgi:hypothetical protein